MGWGGGLELSCLRKKKSAKPSLVQARKRKTAPGTFWNWFLPLPHSRGLSSDVSFEGSGIPEECAKPQIPKWFPWPRVLVACFSRCSTCHTGVYVVTQRPPESRSCSGFVDHLLFLLGVRGDLGNQVFPPIAQTGVIACGVRKRKRGWSQDGGAVTGVIQSIWSCAAHQLP